MDFCANWDQNSFDPDYPSEPLDTFEPLVREIFSRALRTIRASFGRRSRQPPQRSAICASSRRWRSARRMR